MKLECNYFKWLVNIDLRSLSTVLKHITYNYIITCFYDKLLQFRYYLLIVNRYTIDKTYSEFKVVKVSDKIRSPFDNIFESKNN